MEEMSNKEVIDEEFNIVIVFASTNTAPSPTGLTFNMIKKWPEDVKKVKFAALCNFMVDKRSPHTVEIDMAVSEAQKRLGNSDSK